MSEVKKRKEVFFIRHGQTKMNLRRIHQGPEEPLTPAGREGVRQVVAFLQDKEIDTLISSNYLRARQTADMIAEVIDTTYSIEPSVREIGRPLSVYGRHHFSLISFRYFINLYRNRLNLLWNEAGAENLAHVRERVRDARLMVESLPGQRIAVVSHGIFMGMFAETVCYNQPLSLLKFLKGLIGHRQIPNTGILHFTCEPSTEEEKKCTWFLEETLFPPYNEESTK
ncbi:histidine phosphatase family protein [Candidatus Nomurabacteria bacterium]|nr:histidine phosphatase family protein [Candidatus Nomurabacteria bacterium]MCB9819216.1 histidine phosphatase family protein [Candidatus Nomurabacteria bacterium]